MQNETVLGRRKQFVEVVVSHRVDGTVAPQKVIMTGGQTFDIETSEDPYAAKTKPTGAVHRYPVTIKGKETYLYEDDGRWWVLLKE